MRRHGALTRPPLAPKPPQFPARAKRVIFLFMEGGPSHLDTFDPKPKLNELAGQPLPASFGKVITADGRGRLAAAGLASGSGSSTARAACGSPTGCRTSPSCVDDLAVIRSCWCRRHQPLRRRLPDEHRLDRSPAGRRWAAGSPTASAPRTRTCRRSSSCRTAPARSSTARGTGAPGSCRPSTRASASSGGNEPIPNLHNPPGVTADRQRGKLDLLERAQPRARRRPAAVRSELDARIASYELAFRMQADAPEAVDLSQETEDDQAALRHGRQGDRTSSGRNCLLARRLVERGVRFVQVYHGAGSKWDAHAKIEKNHSELCRSMDKPVAGLLTDLKRRGLLDDTLVIWGGEFGRTPMSEKGDGRDHNPTGFTMWMAGGGVQGRPGHRRDRRVRPARRRGPAARPRPARHHPAPARPRQHGPGLQVQGPARAADAQRGRGVSEGGDGVRGAL